MKKYLEYIQEENLKSRFMEKVKKLDNGCWKYSAHKGTDLYGQFWKDGSARPAHIVSYELHKGSAPKGKVLMHSCNHRWCVNPAHLKPGTKEQNAEHTVKSGRNRNQYTKSRTAPNTPNSLGTR